ncbi:uncharacterized protein LOC123527703 [Mercenaria mercenaria]|uniref:uncharacterized protein LOC123527703 n=1 Tax=Mercenaria mercenaria TaxID=6596 RepID=UPI00234EA874|nr:uncharacterized protein LOC123527703 [Mercenaria mercenaria]
MRMRIERRSKFLKDKMATGGSEVTSDEIFNFKCSACDKLNKNREAVKYCVECQGYCCQSCVDMHRAFPALIGHSLLDKTSFNSATFTTDLPEVPTVRCDYHETKIVDMYCENHDVVGCTTCMALNHRSCKDVHSIPDVIETTFQRLDVDTTVQKLLDTKTTMTKMKESKKIFLQELLKSKTKAINAIKKYRREMEILLENMEKESIMEVEKKFGEIECILNQEKNKAEKEEDTLKRDAGNLQKSDGNRAQQFVYMKTAQTKFAETETVLRSLEERNDTTLSFVESPDIRKFLQNVKTLGTVKSPRPTPCQPKTTLYTVNNSRSINVKTSSDTPRCDVRGSCFTENGFLLLADYSNKKLKRVDIVKMSVVDQCDLSSGPNGVCSINKQEVAVSLYNKSIQFVSLDNQMYCTRQIKLDHAAFGVAYKEKILYITDNFNSHSLFIHDMTGNLLQTVSSDGYRNIFKNCWHLAFSDDGDTLFVTTYDGIVTLNAKGQVKSYYDAKLNNVIGVCTDKRGNIFASAYGSSKIKQVEQGGMKELGVIAQGSDGVNKPYSVCFDPCQNLLVVTQYDTDNIVLFELQ